MMHAMSIMSAIATVVPFQEGELRFGAGAHEDHEADRVAVGEGHSHPGYVPVETQRPVVSDTGIALAIRPIVTPGSADARAMPTLTPGGAGLGAPAAGSHVPTSSPPAGAPDSR